MDESSFITVTDDDGTEYVFEILDEAVVDEVRYFLMTMAPDAEAEDADEDYECFILKEVVDEATGESTLATVDDDAEYDAAAEVFDRQFEESLDDEV